jgi:cytochrome c oxidase subunit 1
MPRRIPDYPDGFQYWNSFMTLGSFLTFFSLIIFLSVVFNAFNNKSFITYTSTKNFFL